MCWLDVFEFHLSNRFLTTLQSNHRTYIRCVDGAKRSSFVFLCCFPYKSPKSGKQRTFFVKPSIIHEQKFRTQNIHQLVAALNEMEKETKLHTHKHTHTHTWTSGAENVDDEDDDDADADESKADRRSNGKRRPLSATPGVAVG